MKYLPLILGAVSTFAIFGSSLETAQDYPDFPPANSKESLESTIQSFSVKILNDDGSSGVGSGVIIARQGNTYTVLTNGHVLPVDTNIALYRVATSDGQIYRVARSEQQPSINLDAVLLEFTSDTPYQPVQVASSRSLLPGQLVLLSGFPAFSKDPLAKVAVGTLVMPSGVGPLGGYEIGYQGSFEQGMSGGPLLNQSGELIGLNGGLPFSDPNETNLSWAIPIDEIFATLR